jgi:hypothetical protein
MFAVRTESARGLAALGAVALGVLMLLLLPAMASANPDAPAASSPVVEEAPAVDLTMAEPAPSEPAPPPPSEPAAAQETSEPAPPPASEPEQPAPAPAPAADAQPSPPLTSPPPDAPESPAAESAPEPETALILPASPGYPGGARGATAADRILAAAPGPPPSSSPVSAPTSPPDAPAGLGAAASGASAAGDTLAREARKALAPRSGLVEALGGVQRPRSAVLDIDRDAGPGPAGAAATGADGENPFDTIAATGGPAPAGSSLLAVLASYAIPGGGVPTSTLILFMQLAVILIAVYAPRSGVGERLLALGRLGPRFGYRTVLARPG